MRSGDILGISAYYHDSAAALVRDGGVIAAAQEERFSRKRHDANFPHAAITYCLREASSGLRELSAIVFYEKPLVKFERLLETYLAYAPLGWRSFVASMPLWLKEKLYLKSVLRKELAALAGCQVRELPPLFFTGHHQSHAASAFFPSPYERAAVLCLDGVGEWTTTSAWRGQGADLTPLWELKFPHSLGLLYSAFTSYAGFKVNSGEYKLMGLAPYGHPRFVQSIWDHVVDVKLDGTFRLNMDYFNYATGLTMTNDRFHTLFGGSPRKATDRITQRDMDIARSIQDVMEDIVLRLTRTIHKETGETQLCLAGGVALNCVANGRILRDGNFHNIWIQPAAGDAGGALGAALAVWHQYRHQPRTMSGQDGMKGAFLGPAETDQDIRAYLTSVGAAFVELDEKELLVGVARLLAHECVVGWFQGRMEFGPRALGNRSILGDPRSPTMQSVMNVKIKHRESFRPFAPAVLAEKVSEYFDLNAPSPYMLIVASIQDTLKIPINEEDSQRFGIEQLNVPRSTIPAVTHVDDSARVQTVHQDTNPRFHALIREFERQTGCAVLVNTSFNVRGEPIVCTIRDAYQCFMRTEMDYLAAGNVLLSKADQSKPLHGDVWKMEFPLD